MWLGWGWLRVSGLTLVHNGVIHIEARGGLEASRCCDLRLVVSGDSPRPSERTVNASISL